MQRPLTHTLMEKCDTFICKWKNVALECNIEQSIHELNAQEEIIYQYPPEFLKH